MSAVSEIRYAQNGDVHVAYQTLGDGPLDIVFVEGFMTHLGAQWEDLGLPPLRRPARRVRTRDPVRQARHGAVRPRAVGTLEERMDDVRAVMDAVGSERAALIGISEGGPMSMLFAASYPERTRACSSSAPR